MNKNIRLPKTLLLILVLAINVSAQDGGLNESSLVSWISLDAPPGREYLATDAILRSMPGWKRDDLGNLILRKGSGSPRRVIACALDRPGFAVTEITDDGYLRLREAGAGRQHSLWIQFHEGQRIKVLTRPGVVPGVMIVKSTHLQRGRVANAPLTTLDDLWVDVGAASGVEVQRLGIEMLDPVVRDSAAWSYGDFVAGPLASVRVGCAAVAHAAQGQVSKGETIFLLTTLRSFGHDGLEAALRSIGRVDEVTVLDQGAEDGNEAVSQRKVEKPLYLPESTGLTSLTTLAPRVRFSGTLVESVQRSDAEKLFAAVEKAASVSIEPARRYLSFSLHQSQTPRQDALSSTANLLKSFADVPSVSGHERPVREAIIAALPAWARPVARTDNEGNLIVEAGPDRDPVMFIAHQDEVGFEVTNIAADGTVSLRTRGGLFPSLWEGQPALLHFDRAGEAPLAGVFVPRATATTKQPEALTAWFGMDAEGLKKRGVSNGLSVTAFKSATRLGNSRFTARALDDRAGSTALVLAARRITPATLKRKVIFSWSVREETGLEGAIALAKQYGSSVKRVYSVDTFVSSDSPAESTRFAYAPLGRGAVIRGLDNSAVAPLPELDRILNIARTNAIPIQVGATNGGTDGSDSCGMVCCTLVCRGPDGTVTRQLRCSIFEICRRWRSSFIRSRSRLEVVGDRIYKICMIEKMRLIILLCLLILPLQVFGQQDLTRSVNPFIGTGGHGHTFPGAIVPFGMVQLSPDTRLTGWDGCSGYHYSDSAIYGFSHTHLSGTGISDYGDILLLPTLKRARSARFQHSNETATPGYYSVKLDDDNIFVELTATARTGLHRYTFPKTEDANVIIDLAHRDKVIDSELQVISNTAIVGWRRSQAWAKDQIVYFAAEFSQPFTSRDTTDDLRTSFRFDIRSGAPLLVKVGISSVDVDGALKNLNAELSHWDFDKVKAEAKAAWNRELNKMAVTGGTDAQLTNFYTAIYHAMTAPNLFMDVDGRYRGRDFKIHKAEDFSNYTVFSLWDTFRAAHPLYNIIDQKRTRDFIRTFLVQYEQGGRLPVWELAANETDTMIGYHAVSVIADAAAKGIDGFDLNKAYEAMKHSAEFRQHRGLGAYIDQGFISMEDERESVSKVLEYAYDDWCIAEVARMLGKTADYERYRARAQSYKNVFDSSTGFMRPRSNGNWLEPFDPREVTFGFTEANSWQYTFFAPHDVSGLIALMGGRRKFAEKLDQLFAADSRTTGREQVDITGLIGQYAHGNEPSHHMAYLYNYVGQPWKTQSRVRQIMDQFYKPDPDGLIGNEDCGQMSAWYVLSAAGFYPVTPGSTVYVIGSPLFPEVRFNLENGKSFVVRAVGVSERNVYVQSATLNGKPYPKSFLLHSDLMAGGEIIFRMGPRPNLKWGTGAGNEPVARIAGREIVPVPVIKAAGQTFRGRQEISLAGIGNLYYSTDGSEPNTNSRRFTKPFFIDADTTVKAFAVAGGSRSLVVTAKYHRIPHDWKLTLQSNYSSQYTGGGDLALIDGIRGTTNWSGGAWQGYQGKDLIALIDLGEVQQVSKVGAGFLQDIGSWIWLPSRFEVELSTDGKAFDPVISIVNDGSEKREGAITRDFVKSITPRKARYIRIRALNFGKIPAWHPGSGGDAWIFADEIIIEK